MDADVSCSDGFGSRNFCIPVSALRNVVNLKLSRKVSDVYGREELGSRKPEDASRAAKTLAGLILDQAERLNLA